MSVVYLDRRTTVLAAAALCGVFIAGILIGHFGSGFAGSSGSSSEPAAGVSPLRLGPAAAAAASRRVKKSVLSVWAAARGGRYL